MNDAVSPGSRKGGAWAALSLESKLPLLLGAFLLAATLALAIAGYVAVRRNAIAGGTERSESIVSQFRELFVQQSTQLRAQVTQAAARPDLVAFARDPRPEASEKALAAMRYVGPQPESVVGTSARSKAGRFSLTNVPVGIGAALDERERQILANAAGSTDSARVGRFHLVDGAMLYATIAPIGGDSTAVLIQWRRLALSARTRGQLSQLLGADATLLLGNADDSLWTDMERVIMGPRDYPAAIAGPRMHEHDGHRFMARASAIPGTRWLVAVEMPHGELMAPVNRFVRQVGTIALLVIGIGLLVAWRVSRGITEPLIELTTAATAVARGELREAPRVERADEIGHLSDAFGKMLVEVEHARAALEAKVAERTRDLNAAMAQLSEAQDTLVRREKMATLGQLASGVGHELRNPLGVMTNAVYYLRAVLASQPDTVREYLDILHQQITLSEKIVADLLDFARSKPPHRVPTDLARVVEAQVTQLRAAGHAAVGVQIEVPTDLPPVLADATQAGQVVLNLLTNASQAMDGHGTITVRARARLGRVELDVSDTGPGIAAENLERIFEPLFTTKARGIGLGLALSRTLARANGGDLAARNNAGRGAVLLFSLPIATEGT